MSSMSRPATWAYYSGPVSPFARKRSRTRHSERCLPVRLLWSMLFACSVTGCSSASQSDLELMQGEWTVVSWHIYGRQLPKESLLDCRVIINESELTLMNGGTVMAASEFRLDSNAAPKSIDIRNKTSPKDHFVLGIFEFLDGELHLCWMGRSDRPTVFEWDGESSRFNYQVLRR